MDAMMQSPIQPAGVVPVPPTGIPEMVDTETTRARALAKDKGITTAAARLLLEDLKAYDK